MKNGPYTLIIAPKEYPGKKYRGRYCYEHHFIYWKHKKKIPKEGEVVHHKNGNKTDNQIRNLEILTQLEHSGQHHAIKYWAITFCDYCGKHKQNSLRNYRPKILRGQTEFFCHNSCQMKWQWENNKFFRK